MKFYATSLLVFCSLLLLASPSSPKNIILFIGDGMSTPQRMIAEEFALKSGHGPLVMNHLPFHATTRTCSANSLVTDSAAAGTAIACGEKTNNGRIGMDIAGTRTLTSVAYAAQKTGRKVGIVTSVTINHATPAAFYAHRPSRSQYYEIGLDLIASKFDFFGGGGFSGNKKEADKDLYTLAEKAGYKVIRPGKDMTSLKPADGKALVCGASGALPYTIDENKMIPTLKDYTAKAIEMLENPNGFFLMVEGGSIDWGGHSNDAATNLREVLALDDAIRTALDFQKKDPDTLIVITGDHETGGMTMGFAGTGYALYTERLANQKTSVANFRSILKKAMKENPDFNFDNALELLNRYFGFKTRSKEEKDPMVLTAKERKMLETAFRKNNLPNTARIVMSGKAGVGWTSGSHTALPVLTTSKGPQAEIFTGFIDNTDISNKLKSIMK